MKTTIFHVPTTWLYFPWSKGKFQIQHSITITVLQTHWTHFHVELTMQFVWCTAWGHLLWSLANLVIRYQSSGYLVSEGCEIILRKCQSSCVVMVISFLASASQWMILQLFPSAREKICTEVYGILIFGEEFFVLKFTDHVFTMVPGDTVAPCIPPWFIQIYGL